MVKNRNIALVFLIISIVLFYGWNFIFTDNEWMRAIGASLFPIIGGALSLFWVRSAFKSILGQERYFWLLLGIGIFLYIVANFIWFVVVFTQNTIAAPEICYLFWVTAYVFYLIALVYKSKLIRVATPDNPYFFNIVIFMIVAVVISTHYLIGPILAIMQNSFEGLIIGLMYPILDLSILFVSVYLYYLTRDSRQKTAMFFITMAFCLQVVADLSFAYLGVNGGYYPGSLFEPLWFGSVLLIGFAGFFVQKEKNEFHWKIMSDDHPNDSRIPYISIIVLVVLLIESYQWYLNTLAIGMTVILFLIMGRHLLVTNRNKALMSEYRELAYHDPLTGIYNRTSFQYDLDHVLKQAKSAKSSFAVLLIDLDRFKMVNDTLGHHAGDMILQEATKRLLHSINSVDRIFRLGGDEFIIILHQATRKNSIEIAETIISEFEEPFSVLNHNIAITPSIGISLFPDNGTTSDSLLQTADAAMYQAKGSGRNKYRFFNAELNQIMTRKMMIENELRNAIVKKELTLVYQPKIDLASREVMGMEALLRWNNSELGEVSPVEFIPVAEETGLIVVIGEWVLKTAAKQNKDWQNKGLPSLCISVNVSANQFKHSDFVKTVRDTLIFTNLDPSFLELEITESIMQNIEETTEILQELRSLGVKLTIDDFGTGYSSLHVLKALPIDTIKIDKAFIDDITETFDQSMVKGIIDISSNLNLQIVAEGVEHKYQLQALTKYQCHYGQGYLFSKPVDAAGFEKYLKEKE